MKVRDSGKTEFMVFTLYKKIYSDTPKGEAEAKNDVQ